VVERLWAGDDFPDGYVGIAQARKVRRSAHPQRAAESFLQQLLEALAGGDFGYSAGDAITRAAVSERVPGSQINGWRAIPSTPWLKLW